MYPDPILPADQYNLAAALTIADLDDGKRHRLTAAEQRAIFGFAVCGKKEFEVEMDGQSGIRYNRPEFHGHGIIILRKQVIPNDSIFAMYTLVQMAEAINSKTPLGPF